MIGRIGVGILCAGAGRAFVPAGMDATGGTGGVAVKVLQVGQLVVGNGCTSSEERQRGQRATVGGRAQCTDIHVVARTWVQTRKGDGGVVDNQRGGDTT